MGDELSLPVGDYLSTELLSGRSLHDALHEETVFQVPEGR